MIRDKKVIVFMNKSDLQFSSKIIDDQQITVKDIMKHILIAVIHIIIPEGIVLKDIYQMEGGEINNSVGCVEQFTGNAIGQKCLADFIIIPQ